MSFSASCPHRIPKVGGDAILAGKAAELLLTHVAEPCEHLAIDFFLVLEDTHGPMGDMPSLKLMQRNGGVSHAVVTWQREDHVHSDL